MIRYFLAPALCVALMGCSHNARVDAETDQGTVSVGQNGSVVFSPSQQSGIVIEPTSTSSASIPQVGNSPNEHPHGGPPGLANHPHGGPPGQMRNADRPRGNRHSRPDRNDRANDQGNRVDIQMGGNGVEISVEADH